MSVSHFLHQDWTFFDSSSKRLLKAQVPGCIHTDLRRHKLIPDPFWGANEKELQWIEERDWTYRTEFLVPASVWDQEHVDLVFDGLDTLAAIRLNGRLIGRTDNMFVGYRFSVKDLLKRSKNTLEITFASPMKYIRERQSPTDLHEPNDPVGGCSHIRKEQCSFGWDWGPRFATSGIYKAMRLEAWTRNRFEQVRITQKHQKRHVQLMIAPRLALSTPCEIRGIVSLNGKVVAEIRDNQATIPNPKLWWPNGYGEQPLYTVDLELVEQDRVLDKWITRLGLREILLDRHSDEFGESFQFVVNGRAIFAKGANWIPAHSFVTEVDRNHYDNLLTSATDAHMNMIRLWGGGIYEMDAFYDLCDEKGLLVWHDFMFACALYPGTPEFLDSVRKEAEYQVARIANRTCLALWCGNNEIEQWSKAILERNERKAAYEEVFYKLLPEVVTRLDGVTAYWPSSPHNPKGLEKGHNNESAGDSHFWDVWHARHPVKRYEEKRFRFCSEFGMQSYSSPEVAATFCRPEDFNVFGPAMENHQKNAAGNAIILDYVSRLYRMPKDYASLAYLSQLNQAYCMRVGIEHFRRSRPCTMGALYWQLNDCWPVFSWSSIEFGGKWKALHYAAKRFFAPVLLSAHVLGTETIGIGNTVRSTIGEVDLFTLSDLDKKTSGTINWVLYHLNGKVLDSGTRKVTLAPDSSRKQVSLNFKSALKKFGARKIYLRINLETSSGHHSEATVFFTAPRFLDFPQSPISTRVKQVLAREFDVTLRSKNFHHQVQVDVPAISHHADDNFLDLYPGEARTVRIRCKQDVSLTEFRDKLIPLSLVHTY